MMEYDFGSKLDNQMKYAFFWVQERRSLLEHPCKGGFSEIIFDKKNIIRIMNMMQNMI